MSDRYSKKNNNQSKSNKSNLKSFIVKLLAVIMIAAMVLLYCIGSFGSMYAQAAEKKDRNGISLASSGGAIYVAEYDEFIWSYNLDKQYNPASTSKLLTCLIAAEKLDLNETYTVTKDVLNLPDTTLFLVDGEELTGLELMHLALIQSCNEAANMLAYLVAGSADEFALLMNDRAVDIGCTNSEFNNPTGLNNPRNYVTAHDMCLITQEAFNNPTIKEICGKATWDMEATNKRNATTIKNTNLLLEGGKFTIYGTEIEVDKVPEVIGGKTGTTVSSKTTFAVCCEINGLHVYITILNGYAEDRFSDMTKLIEYAKSYLNPYTCVEAGFEFEEQASVKGGNVNKVNGKAAEDGLINLPEGASASLVTVTPIYQEDLTAPIEEGQVIGEAEIRIADEYMHSIDIIAVESVNEGWFLSKFGITNKATIIIIAVFALIFGLFITVRTLRYKNKKKRAARRKARLREIARQQMEREQDVRQRDWPY